MLGYPVELKIDVDEDAIDDEGGWQVIDLEVVSAVPCGVRRTSGVRERPTLEHCFVNVTESPKGAHDLLIVSGRRRPDSRLDP
jgi:hypothetical protein